MIVDKREAILRVGHDATAYPDNRTPGSLGSLIVGDDDAPSTLRFVQNNSGVPVGMFTDPSNIYNFSVKAGHRPCRP